MTVTPLHKSDPTAAARMKRMRKRRREGAVTVPNVTLRHHSRLVPAVTLVAALSLATVSAGFSIVGLTAIFAGRFWPIIGMGCALEFGKLSGVAWLGQKRNAPIALKAVMVALIATLILLNAVGCYGFLAHAHLEHAVTNQIAVDAKAADIDARKQIQVAVVADQDKRIGQIDSAINEATKRGRTGAAVALIAQETSRRSDLAADRLREARKLGALQIEAAALTGERDKIAADAGPVRYLSILLGINDETAMRFFILSVALLLDPAAMLLLLAATVRRNAAARQRAMETAPEAAR